MKINLFVRHFSIGMKVEGNNIYAKFVSSRCRFAPRDGGTMVHFLKVRSENQFPRQFNLMNA